MRKVFIFGATSAIAQATARLFAADGDQLFLVARNAIRLQAVADDLRVRGARRVEIQAMDATDYGRHPALIEAACRQLDALDIVLIAHGSLPNQRVCESSFEQTRQEFEINALSVISLLTHLANRLERQGYGTLAVISSVAGDRGRKSNYVYGSAKAALSNFLEGLRNRLHSSGVHVVTIKPGFVDTPMTANFKKGALWSTPNIVAKGIYQAIRKKKDTVYLPGFWSGIMLIIRAIPERIYKRLDLAGPSSRR